MRGGELFSHPTWEPHTVESACSSLLPTPTANNYECDPEVFLPRRERLKAKHMNGNGFGLTLGMAVRLLPTPQARDGSRWGRGNARQYLRSERSNNLDDAVEWMVSGGAPLLLPSSDGSESSDEEPLTLWTSEDD